MRRVLSVGFLSLLAMSMVVSLGFVQFTRALPKGEPWEDVYLTVWMITGEGESNLEWLAGWNIYPIHWWGEPDRPPFPPAEYFKDGVYVCYGDWKMGCELYAGTFRYQWWIYWEPEEVVKPDGKSFGGKFAFSHGTEDFKGMLAFGEAWVETEPPGYPFGYQYHEGMIKGGPE